MITVNDLEAIRVTRAAKWGTQKFPHHKREKTLLHAMIESCDDAEFLELLARFDYQDDVVKFIGYSVSAWDSGFWNTGRWDAKGGIYRPWRMPSPRKEDYRRNLKMAMRRYLTPTPGARGEDARRDEPEPELVPDRHDTTKDPLPQWISRWD